MKNKKQIRLYNRDISNEDIAQINHLIERDCLKGRTHISKELCELWQWRNSSGQIRDLACRQLLLKLEEKGYIKLPPKLRTGRLPGYKNKTYLPSNIT